MSTKQRVGAALLFFFKQKPAYDVSACLVGSEICKRDRARLGGEIFRISNMGDHPPAAIERGLAAVADALTTAGVDADADAAVTAAQTVLRP